MSVSIESRQCQAVRVAPGQMSYHLLPHSEVCMHMRVAGQKRFVRLLPGGRMAQIYNADFSCFSSPITYGEAGFYLRDGRFYTYQIV